MELTDVNDKELFKREYFGVKPCLCSWMAPTTPQGWQSVLEEIEYSVKNNENIVMTKSAGYILPKPKHKWPNELTAMFEEFKPKDQFIQSHIYISLFGFSELFSKHHDPGQNIFVVAGEGSADWTIEGYDDFVLGPKQVLYFPGIMYHHARSKGPRYSVSVVIETLESRSRNTLDGDLTQSDSK
tara:strand:+ start:297 stop:848 length:552 start_codon:yes stop_codon:yes gene_type:complete